MSKFIQTLTWLDGTNAPTSLGLVIDGGRPGPSLLVSGFSVSTIAIYERLTALPSIAHLRGRLTLVYVDRLGGDCTATAQVMAPRIADLIGAQDDSLFLPFLPDDRLDQEAQAKASDEDYWTILAKMAALGMITGRGVSDRRIAAQMGAEPG